MTAQPVRKCTSPRASAQTTARLLLSIGAVNARPQEPYKLTSGRLSPVYVDCRRIISFPTARDEIMDLAVKFIKHAVEPGSIDMVAGGETAGIPFAAWIAQRMDLPMLYVRKEPKGFGRMAQIEGHMEEGVRVLLVEDLATDGGSKIHFVNALREGGAEVCDAFVVFHYGIFPESTESLLKMGVRLLGLTTWWDVLEAAQETGAFDEATVTDVRTFLEDPQSWSQDREQSCKQE
jgi:orotate phosphoribosyltransferase